MNISMNIFRILIKLLGKLSVDDMDRLIGGSDSDEIGKWYFENRKFVK